MQGETIFHLFKPEIPQNWSQLSWGVFIALGILLPSVFIIMGKAVEYVGIAKSDVAQRLSLILPIIAATVIFGETLVSYKLVGIALAFIALLCLLASNNVNTTPLSKSFILVAVWFGYGTIDILLKRFSQSPSLAISLAVMFGLAGILMFVYLFIKKTHWTIKNILWGLVLGIFNFYNILFYIKAHQHLKDDPTLVFTGMNIGVIALGTIVGAIIFKEKLSAINWGGIAVAICAIVVLFYGSALI